MEIFITSVRAGDNDDVAVCFEIRDGENRCTERLLIPISVYTELSLCAGKTDRDVFDVVEKESKIYLAYRKALYLLSFGSQSARALQRKLVTRGYEPEIVFLAIERLERNHLLCEESSAIREAEKCVEKLWGESRIRSHLASKGYGGEEIKKAFLALEDNGVDFTLNCSRLIEKRYLPLPKDKRELQKIIAALTRYGYSISQIKASILKLT